MRSIALLLFLVSILPLSACADDPAESSVVGANPAAADTANKQDTDESLADAEAESVSAARNVEGDGPRVCSSREAMEVTKCFTLTSPNIKFGQYVPVLAKRACMTEKEFIEANGWEPYLNDIIDTETTYLYLVKDEAFSESGCPE